MMAYLPVTTLLLLLTSSCVIIKKPGGGTYHRNDDSAPRQTTQPPGRLDYNADEIRSVRKLAADAIYNNFNPELSGASFKAALLNNVEATALVIDNPDVLSIAIDPTIAPFIIERVKASFPQIIQTYEDLSKKDFLKEDRLEKKMIEARQVISEKYVIAAIHAIPGDYYLEQDTAITQLIERYDFADVAAALESIQSIPVPEDLGSVTDFFNDILKYYFKEQPIADKRRIFSVVLQNTMPKANNAQLARALVMGAGPIFQKYIQKLSDRLAVATQRGTPSREVLALKEALDVVKDGLLPNPKHETDRNFLEISRRTQGKITLQLLRYLGQASVGVAMLVNVTENGRSYPAVYKELRTNIRDIVEREAYFFARIAAKHGQARALERKKNEIIDEMNLEHERENLLLAAKYYNDSPLVADHFKDKYPGTRDLIRAVTLVDIPLSPHYLAMHLAPGESVKSIIGDSAIPKTEAEKRREKIKLLVTTQLMSELVEKWTMVGFFLGNSGAFHGDLHSGNIFVDIDLDFYEGALKHKRLEQIDTVAVRGLMHTPGNEERQTLTMIDFGVMPQISEGERAGLLNVLVATEEAQSAEGFIQGLETLAPDLKEEFKDVKRREDIKKGLDRQFNSNSPDVTASIVTFLGEKRVNLPHVFINFSDAMLMLENIFKSLQKRCEGFGFYEPDMADLFKFKKIMGATIESQMGWLPLTPSIRTILRYVSQRGVASPYAPRISLTNLQAIAKRKAGLKP